MQEFTTRFKARWTFRHARGYQSQRGEVIHGIRKRLRRARHFNFQNITDRFLNDVQFRTEMLMLGRTLETIQEWDAFAAQETYVQGIPYEERVRRYGDRAYLALDRAGRDTHHVRYASNYDELRAQGPPNPDEVPHAKGKSKGKSKGRNPPRQSHSRWPSSQSSSPYGWQQPSSWRWW